MTEACRKILVVEDEPMISMMVELYLADLGHSMVGCVETVSDAMSAIPGGGFDLVVLDVNLRDGRSDRVAEELGRLGVPFIVSSGAMETAPPWSGRPSLCKPFTFDDVRQALDRVA